MEDRALADFFPFSGRYMGERGVGKVGTFYNIAPLLLLLLLLRGTGANWSMWWWLFTIFSSFCGARAPSLLWRRGKRGKNEAIYFCNVSCDLRFRARAKTAENVWRKNIFFVLALREKTARSQNSQYVFGQPFFFLFQLHFHVGVGNAVMLLSPNGIWRKMGEREKVFSSLNCVSGPLWSHYMGEAKRRRNGVRDEQHNFRNVKFEGLLQKVSYV